jgi:hypothetical protein
VYQKESLCQTIEASVAKENNANKPQRLPQGR